MKEDVSVVNYMEEIVAFCFQEISPGPQKDVRNLEEALGSLALVCHLDFAFRRSRTTIKLK